MATSIAEQIAAKVQARLGLISTTSGYQTTASEVVRPTRLGGFRPQDYQLIVTQGDQTVIGVRPGNPPAIEYEMPVMIAAILRQSESDTTAKETAKNQFWADTVKALTIPQASWHNWDNLAINSRIGDVEDYQAGDGGSSGFMFPVFVHFRVSENDPYTVRV